MPIEFPCPQCGRTLRTPDGSSGKRAKCPSCEMVTTIPEASAPAADNPFAGATGGSGQESNPFAAAGAAADNPFSDFSERSPGSGGYGDSSNPYASPHAAAYTPTVAPSGTLARGKIDFSDVLSVSWNILKENMGNLVLLALMLFGMVIGVYIVFLAAVFIGAAIGGVITGAGGGGPVDPTAIFIGIGIAVVVIGIPLLFAFGWIGAGITKYTLAVTRGQPASLSEVFNGQKYMMRMTGFLFVTQVLIAQGMTYLGAAPGFLIDEPGVQAVGQVIGQIIGMIVNAFMLPLAGYFIVDRDVGVMQSFSMSIEYLGGNRLILFALYLVVGILGTLFVLFTCGIGALFYFPYYMILMTVVYLIATGQAVRR